MDGVSFRQRRVPAGGPDIFPPIDDAVLREMRAAINRQLEESIWGAFVSPSSLVGYPMPQSDPNVIDVTPVWVSEPLEDEG